jgi:hypothetical protein
MVRRGASLLAVAAATAAGCGSEDPPFPAACNATSVRISQALRTAPAPVALDDGTRLSACVARAREDAEIQTVSAQYTQGATALAARVAASDAAAVQLGYLIGATRRGAQRTAGIHLELLRRLEQTVALDGVSPHRRAAFRRGLAAGLRTG